MVKHHWVRDRVGLFLCLMRCADTADLGMNLMGRLDMGKASRIVRAVMTLDTHQGVRCAVRLVEGLIDPLGRRSGVTGAIVRQDTGDKNEGSYAWTR